MKKLTQAHKVPLIHRDPGDASLDALNMLDEPENLQSLTYAELKDKMHIWGLQETLHPMTHNWASVHGRETKNDLYLITRDGKLAWLSVGQYNEFTLKVLVDDVAELPLPPEQYEMVASMVSMADIEKQFVQRTESVEKWLQTALKMSPSLRSIVETQHEAIERTHRLLNESSEQAEKND